MPGAPSATVWKHTAAGKVLVAGNDGVDVDSHIAQSGYGVAVAAGTVPLRRACVQTASAQTAVDVAHEVEVDGKRNVELAESVDGSKRHGRQAVAMQVARGVGKKHIGGIEAREGVGRFESPEIQHTTHTRTVVGFGGDENAAYAAVGHQKGLSGRP